MCLVNKLDSSSLHPNPERRTADSIPGFVSESAPAGSESPGCARAHVGLQWEMRTSAQSHQSRGALGWVWDTHRGRWESIGADGDMSLIRMLYSLVVLDPEWIWTDPMAAVQWNRPVFGSVCVSVCVWLCARARECVNVSVNVCVCDPSTFPWRGIFAVFWIYGMLLDRAGSSGGECAWLLYLMYFVQDSICFCSFSRQD